MSDRNWYFEGGNCPDGFITRDISYDTTLYREIIELKEKEGTDESILAGLTLLDIVDAAELWTAVNTDEPYAHAPILLTDEEWDIVAAAENHWYHIPGNRKRQEVKLHKEYRTRLGAAVTALTGCGYEASGDTSRSRMFFRLQASHPSLQGDEGFEKAWEATFHKDDNYGFSCDVEDSGLVVVNYTACPPGSRFEPVIQNLTKIV